MDCRLWRRLLQWQQRRRGDYGNALSGQYAFVLAGFDANANPMGIAGSLKADGLGHITGGTVDVNDNGVVSSSSTLAGTYTIDSNQRGTITLTNTVGSVTHTLTFGFALRASGVFGDIMDLDTNNFIVAGTMQQQNSSAFSLSGLAGDYIVELNGRNASAPTSVLGRFTLGQNGASTNVAFDRSIAGTGSAGPTTGACASVTFAAAGPDTNGRGTLTVTLNDAIAAGTQNFVYYAITANRFIAVETDTTGTMTADGSRQTLPFTASTVDTTGAVFGVAGLDKKGNNEISAVGQLQVTGSNTGSLLWDSNYSGPIVGPRTLTNLPVTFDSTTGRATVTVANGLTNGLFNSAAFYLTASGKGFVLDTTAGTSNRAMAGTLTPQTGSPFSVSTTLSGPMIARSRGASVNDAQALVGLIALANNSTYTFTLDQRFPPVPITTQTDVTIAGIIVVTLDASSGRGELATPAPVGTGVFYTIGANQLILLNGPSPVPGPSPLFFFDAH